MTFIKFFKTFYFKAKYLFHAALIYAKDLKICDICYFIRGLSTLSTKWINHFNTNCFKQLNKDYINWYFCLLKYSANFLSISINRIK